MPTGETMPGTALEARTANLPSVAGTHSADGLATAEASPLDLLDAPDLPERGARLLDRDWLGSARLQLAYPWLRTADSAAMAGAVR